MLAKFTDLFACQPETVHMGSICLVSHVDGETNVEVTTAPVKDAAAEGGGGTGNTPEGKAADSEGRLDCNVTVLVPARIVLVKRTVVVLVISSLDTVSS